MSRTMRRADAFLRDDRGNLTMEFVLWLPLLLFWFVVSAVFYDAYKSRDAAAKASYTISDIVSRSTELGVNTIENLVSLQRALLPRAGQTMWLRLSSIRCANSDGCLDPSVAVQSDYEVEWSIVPDQPNWPDEFTKPAPYDDTSTLPINLMPPLSEDAEVVIVDVSVPFIPFADWVGIEAREWTFQVVTWPRFVPAIDLSTGAIIKYASDPLDGYIS
jgi:hypothetical protein